MTTFENHSNQIALKLDGHEKRHGIVSLSTGATHPNMVREPYFLLNVYRVLAHGKLWTIARDEPFETERTETGMTLHWQPTETLPLEMRAQYEVEGDSVVSLRFWIRAARDLSQLEISISSYFDFAFEPYGVLNLPSQDASPETQPTLWKAEDQPFVRGHYIHLSRDDAASITRMDGRWNDANGNSQAPAVYGPHYGAPVAIMAATNLENSSGEAGVFVVQSTSREVCSGISLTYSSDNEQDNIRNHNATYFSLFGEDLKQGEEREAVIRQEVLRGKPTIEIAGLTK